MVPRARHLSSNSGLLGERAPQPDLYCVTRIGAVTFHSFTTCKRTLGCETSACLTHVFFRDTNLSDRSFQNLLTSNLRHGNHEDHKVSSVPITQDSLHRHTSLQKLRIARNFSAMAFNLTNATLEKIIRIKVAAMGILDDVQIVRHYSNSWKGTTLEFDDDHESEISFAVAATLGCNEVSRECNAIINVIASITAQPPAGPTPIDLRLALMEMRVRCQEASSITGEIERELDWVSLDGEGVEVRVMRIKARTGAIWRKLEVSMRDTITELTEDMAP